MKILGARGLTLGDEALNRIPTDYLTDGDSACAQYQDKFYWYILVDGISTPEHIPDIIKPKTGSDSMRWLLKGIYQDEISANVVYTNSLQQLSGGVPLDLNGVASLSGDVFIFNNTTSPPFVSNSTVLVNNLNSEYWGGIHFSEFNLDSLIKSGDQWIPANVDEVYVAFPEQRYNLTYSLFTEIYNTANDTPSIITFIVTDKTMYGFTIKLSSQTDNPHYRIQWAILGENVDVEKYNLQDTYSIDISDNNGNEFIVT